MPLLKHCERWILNARTEAIQKDEYDKAWPKVLQEDLFQKWFAATGRSDGAIMICGTVKVRGYYRQGYLRLRLCQSFVHFLTPLMALLFNASEYKLDSKDWQDHSAKRQDEKQRHASRFALRAGVSLHHRTLHNIGGWITVVNWCARTLVNLRSRIYHWQAGVLMSSYDLYCTFVQESFHFLPSTSSIELWHVQHIWVRLTTSGPAKNVSIRPRSWTYVWTRQSMINQRLPYCYLACYNQLNVAVQTLISV